MYYMRLPDMTESDYRPTCVVTPGAHNVFGDRDLSVYINFLEYNQGAWEFTVTSQYSNGYTYSPYPTKFSFICVQE